MEGIYKVNLIPSDLSMEESVLQIANTLDNLNGIVDDVFSRVMGRIKQNTETTNKLKERIDIAKSKVEKLAGMQKAIKIFSSAKYPTSIVHEHYQSIFDLKGYQHEPHKITLSGLPQRPSREKGIQEKLHFFHVKVAESKMKSGKDFDLETVIQNVSSVGDLLIFNTDESPYLDTKTKEHMPYVPTVRSSVETQNSLEDAPPSIMKRNVLKREIDEYMYAPGMGLVPELDMPLDLPHLPGIAGDVQYSVIGDGSIAPSAATTPVAPGTVLQDVELPDLPDLKELPDVKPEPPATLPDIPDAPTAEPVPKPPAAPSMPIPPPPPPPPPPPMDAPIINKKEKPSASVAPAGDAHANLMAAIRQAGGAGRAKLKPAAEDTTTKGTKAIGGDLMADLHAKLSMRRRGISGAERAGGTVLHTLANIIPEPDDEAPTQRSSSDDDWD